MEGQCLNQILETERDWDVQSPQRGEPSRQWYSLARRRDTVSMGHAQTGVIEKS